MLRILGNSPLRRDALSRRAALQVGGLTLLGEASLTNLLHAQTQAEKRDRSTRGPAQSVILLNLFGGPPHMDMFDMKPDAPANVRGEFQPISTSVTGLQSTWFRQEARRPRPPELRLRREPRVRGSL